MKSRGVGGIWVWSLAAWAVGWSWLVMVRLSQAPVIPAGLWWAGLFFTAVLILFALWRPSASASVLSAAALLLVGFGLLLRLRLAASERWPDSRADWALPIGLFAMGCLWLALRQERYRVLSVLPPLFGGASLALLAVVLAVGRRFRGGMFVAGYMNPTELIKWSLPVCVAGWLAAHAKPLKSGVVNAIPGLIPGAVAWLIAPLLLLVGLRDFGMALQLSLAWVVVLALAFRRPGWVLLGFLAIGVLAWAAFHLVPHARLRYAVWRDPFRDETGAAWQLLQGLGALYHGGLWGRGLGGGSPHLVPIASSDFIYAIIGEELGWIGCGLLLGLYAVLFAAGIRAAATARDDFSRLLAGGWTAMLAAQVLLHVGGVTAALPMTGIPLPMVSHGGSSLVTALAIVGGLCAVADSQERRGKPGARTEGARRKRRVRKRT